MTTRRLSWTKTAAPSQWPWLAPMFAICTMWVWGVKMATVLIEKLRWHIPFCARNKAETFTNPHIRKVGTNTCWIINFPPLLFSFFFSNQPIVAVTLWSMPRVYASVHNYFCPCVLLIVDGTVRVSCLLSSRWSANTAEAESLRQMDWKSNNQATKCPWHLHTFRIPTSRYQSFNSWSDWLLAKTTILSLHFQLLHATGRCLESKLWICDGIRCKKPLICMLRTKGLCTWSLIFIQTVHFPTWKKKWLHGAILKKVPV